MTRSQAAEAMAEALRWIADHGDNRIERLDRINAALSAYEAAETPTAAPGMAAALALLDGLRIDHRNEGTPLRLGGIVEHNARVDKVRALLAAAPTDKETSCAECGATDGDFLVAMGKWLCVEQDACRQRAGRNTCAMDTGSTCSSPHRAPTDTPEGG